MEFNGLPPRMLDPRAPLEGGRITHEEGPCMGRVMMIS